MAMVALAMVVLTGWVWFKEKRNPVELLNPGGWENRQINYDKKVRVMGFLPSWMIGKTRDYCGELDDLVFLGIETNKNGELIWDTQSKKINSDDYIRQKNLIKQCGGKNIVGIKLFKDKELAKLVDSEEGRIKLISEIKGVVEAGGFDGVNMDFEYQASPVAVLEDGFIKLMAEIKAAGLGELSLDVFANTIIRGDQDQLKKILEQVDYLVVMAYDFHTSGSDFAGPVAPLRAGTGDRNIMEIAEKITGFDLNREKVIMAYPLYGYQWKTETSDFGAVSKSYIQMVSLQRSSEIEKNGNGQEISFNWDEVSMSPWMSYTKQETVKWSERVKVGKKWKTVQKSAVVPAIYETYYENEKSLVAKFDLVGQMQLGGVGFWALGYEGDQDWVWDRVARIGK